MECIPCAADGRKLARPCTRMASDGASQRTSERKAMGYQETTVDEEEPSCWALLRRETDSKRSPPRRSLPKKSPTLAEEESHPARQQGEFKSCVSLFSNSATAVIHNNGLGVSQQTLAPGHQAINFSYASYREVDIDQACRTTNPVVAPPTSDKSSEKEKPLPPGHSSADDSGVCLSFDGPDTASFETTSLLSLDDVLAEEVKQAMVELDLRERDREVDKNSDKRKKMLIAKNYVACQSEEICVRTGELVTVMHEDNDFLLVETEDMRFGFVPRACCMMPFSVMFSDTAATCTGSVACLSVLSEDELRSTATSMSSTLDRKELLRCRSTAHAHTSGSLYGSRRCLAAGFSAPGKENKERSHSPYQRPLNPVAGTPMYIQSQNRFPQQRTSSTSSSSSVSSECKRNEKTRFVALKAYQASADQELSVSSGQWLHFSPSKTQSREAYSPTKKNTFFHSDWRWVRCPYTKKEGFVPEDILAVCQ